MNHVLQALLHFFKEIDAGQSAQWDKKKWLDNLQKFGASAAELEKVLNFISIWMDTQKLSVTSSSEGPPDYPVQPHSGTRIYSAHESSRMTKKSRMFIEHLEYIGMLTPQLRETIIDQILQTTLRDNVKVDLTQTQWAAFQTLLQEPPDARIAYLERILFHDMIVLH